MISRKFKDQDGNIVSFEVKRGTRLDIALYENLYATIGTSLDEDSPVLVSDLRTYCKIVCFTQGLKHGDHAGLKLPNHVDGRFRPPSPSSSVEKHADALFVFMECDPVVTDRIAHDVDAVNLPLGASYNPATATENLDESEGLILNDYLPSPEDMPAAN